jgi:flagellin
MNSSVVSQATMAMVRTLDRTQDLLGKSLSRLGSGERIVRPSDDPNGLAKSEKLQSQSRRNQAAVTNAQNSISHLQATDGMLGTISSTLTRLAELAARARDALLNPEQRALYQEEFGILQDQLRQIVGGSTAEIGGSEAVEQPIGRFNGRDLFGADANLSVTVGVFADQTISLQGVNLRVGTFASLISQDASGNFLTRIDDPAVEETVRGAIGQVSDGRAVVGAQQARIGLIAQGLVVEGENLGSAISRIRDADVALETTQMTRYNLRTEATSAMLTQANQSPQSVLRLLQP